jgi:hypothetical protein
MDGIKSGAQKLKDKISPPEPPPTVEALMDRPTPQHFMQLELRAKSLKAKVDNGEDITEKDAADRNRYVAQMEKLQAEVGKYGGDWPEQKLRNQGGKTAGDRITAVLAAFRPLPDQPTVKRQQSKKEQQRQEEHQTTGAR